VKFVWHAAAQEDVTGTKHQPHWQLAPSGMSVPQMHGSDEQHGSGGHHGRCHVNTIKSYS